MSRLTGSVAGVVPKLVPARGSTFSRVLETDDARYILEDSQVRVDGTTPTGATPRVVALDWHAGQFRWRVAPAAVEADSDAPSSLALGDGTPQEWLHGFSGASNSTRVSVGFKLGARRRRAKADKRISGQNLVFVEPPDSIRDTYNEVVTTALALRASAMGVSHQSEVYLDPHTGRKGHGGATKLVANADLTITTGHPAGAKLNFVPLVVHASGHTYFFLPHVLASRTGTDVTANSYDTVRLEVTEWRMQVDQVPSGAEFVGYVWRFMNKDGGPDRRYNDNFQIPVILTWEVDFFIQGVGELHLAFSSRAAVATFKAAFERFQQALADA